jgi:2,3-bisphosphoglycerate-dependent phosphoglycerate mutase
MGTLVLVRHGESEWNRLNLFTGWVDVDLSEAGRKEAAEAGRLMAEAGIRPDVLHTSVLIRAIRTAQIALDEMGLPWLPVRRHWRLNERHYGALTGKDKKETADRFGEEQVKVWRRSYDVPPDPVDTSSEYHPANDPRYGRVPRDQLPGSECLADVLDRVLPYWHDVVCSDLADGRCVLVAAHGNSLRALIKHLERMSDSDIVEFNLPTGIPRVYDLDDADPCTVRSCRYLGDPEEAARKAAAVAAQAGGQR